MSSLMREPVGPQTIAIYLTFPTSQEMIAQQRCAWKYPSYGNPRDVAQSFSAQMAQRDRPPEAILAPPDYFVWSVFTSCRALPVVSFFILFRATDEELVRQTMELITPDGMLAVLFDPSPEAHFEETEKWYVLIRDSRKSRN